MATRVAGAQAKIAIKPQSAFGAFATGNYVYVPFLEFDMAANDQVNTDAVLGRGRQAQRPARDIVEVRGKISVPADSEAIGWWLYGLLGAATVTGEGPYTHVFTSAVATLPLFSLEVQHGDATAPLYVTYRDVMVDGLSVEFAATGRPRLDLDLIATTEQTDTTSNAGTPTTPALNWFHQKVNSLKKDTVALAKIPAFSLRYQNGIEADRYVGGGGEVGALEPGMATGGGTLRARFVDDTLSALAVAATVFDLEAGWTNNADQKLLFELDQVELLRRGRAISGPGGIEQNYEIVGSQDASEGSLLRVTLTNATAVYS